MDISLVKEKLGLDLSASDVDVLAKIQDLRAQCGDDGPDLDKDSPEIQLIKAGQHDSCCTNSDGSITVTLEVPVAFGKSEPISEFTLRRPKMKDLRKAGDRTSNPVAYTATMIATLAGQADKIVDELDGQDVALLSQVVSFLLGRRPRTGK